MKWLQKLLIGLVAFLTLGIITPTHDIWSGLQNKEDAKEVGPYVEAEEQLLEFTELPVVDDAKPLAETFVVRAHELSYEKFGSKIGPVIGEEFDEVIFPRMDKAIRDTLHMVDETDSTLLAMSEKPAGNYSEKIFNVYDERNRKDLIRFHVRTEKRPQDGYFFNFHYHKADDDYAKHYGLGDIHWSKNTPPKWLS